MLTKYRLLRLVAALFIAFSLTYALHESALCTFGNHALEWGVKVAMLTATIVISASLITIKKLVRPAFIHGGL